MVNDAFLQLAFALVSPARQRTGYHTASAQSALSKEYTVLNLWNPDKHLRIRSPRRRLALRMTWYSMILSSVCGVLFSLVFLLDLPNAYADNLTQALILALFFGMGTALFQRLLASIMIGAAMACVSGRFFQRVANPVAYKLVMALTAAAIVHLFAPIQMVRFYLSELAAGEYEPILEVASVFAIYAGAIYLSQVMAGKYIREIATDE